MIWTKTKPTTPGHYWLKMDETACFSEQKPRVVAVFYRNWNDENKDELWVLEGPEFEDGMSMDSASDLFDWSDQCVNLPTVAGSCNCHLYGNAACSSCDDTMPPPIKTEIDMDLPFSEFAAKHLRNIGG